MKSKVKNEKAQKATKSERPTTPLKSPSLKASRSKTDIHRWLAISLDILEQHLFDIVMRPFLIGFGFLFGYVIIGITITVLLINFLFNQNFDLLSSFTFISYSFIIILSITALIVLFIHSFISRNRFDIIHEIIPHQKRFNPKTSLLQYVMHHLTFVSLFSTLAFVVSLFHFEFYYTLLLLTSSLLILIYRTILRYVVPLMVFEEYTYFKAIRESITVFFTSEIKIINQTVIPIVIIFGLGIISTSLVEKIDPNNLNGLIIALVYCGLYFLYYFFFGFTIDYLAFVYARIKKRIEPKVYKKKSVKTTDRTGAALAIVLTIMIPVSIFFGIKTLGQTSVNSTQEAIIISKLQNEKPISLSSQSQSQPFSAFDTVAYRGLEFAVNSFSILQVENKGFANICLLNMTIKNSQSETYQFFPHLTLNIFEQGQGTKIPHYFDTNVTINDEFVLNSYSKYIVPAGLSLRGSMAYDCSNLASQSNIVIQYNMSRFDNTARNANLSIDQFLDFENQSKNAIFKNSMIAMVVNNSEFNKRNISQSLPLTLTFGSIEVINVLESRFCRVRYSLYNIWTKPLNVEFYMTTLVDSSGANRPQANIDEQFNPKNIKATIPPTNSQDFAQDFNCQDGSPSYTLKFTPFADFGPYVSEKSVSVPAII